MVEVIHVLDRVAGRLIGSAAAGRAGG